MLQNRKRYLVVGLSQQLSFALVEHLPSEVFTFEGIPYHDTGHGDATGFYDWLRSSSGVLLGIRFTVFEELEAVCDVVRRLNVKNVNAPDDKPFFEIFFSTNRSFKPELSVDQDFGENKLYLSSEGDYLITFGVERLSESEFNTLQSYLEKRTRGE